MVASPRCGFHGASLNLAVALLGFYLDVCIVCADYLLALTLVVVQQFPRLEHEEAPEYRDVASHTI